MHAVQGEKISLREQVCHSIKEAILEGDLQKGDLLRENTLAKQLGVSRTPVREAIRQLELEGLVASIPNKETVVVGITQGDVEDIFLIRSRLEGLAGCKAAEHITEEELKEMEEILALTSFYVDKEDVEMLKELDHRFHEVIYRSTKSKMLDHVLSEFHHYIQKARKDSLATPGRAKKVLEEHIQIFEAIQRKDIEATETLIEAHIKKAAKNMK